MSKATYVNQQDILDLVIDASESKVTRDITSNVTCGGIKPGDKVSAGDNLTDVIERILNEYQSPTIEIALNPSKTLYEKGVDSLNTLQITAIVTKKSNPVVSVKYYLGSTELEELTSDDNIANGGTLPFTYNGLINNDVTVKVVANDGKSDGVKTMDIKFVYPIYTKIGSNTEVKNIIEKENFILDNINVINDSIVFSYPSIYGNITSILDSNGFEYLDGFTKNSITKNGVPYYEYVSPVATLSNFKYTFIF